MEHTLALIGRAHQGDKEARDTVFRENTGLVVSVAKRFLGRGVEMEELFQIGSIGLLKAVDKFDPSFEVKFSTYAVPLIVGELKRYFRDSGILKVSRSLKENQSRIFRKREELETALGREPTVSELAGDLGLPREEVVAAMEAAAEVESLSRTVYQGDGSEISLLERLPQKEDAQERVLDRILLEELLTGLDARERELIWLRYFQNLTQTEIAQQMGVSQVQVSRMEKKILGRLREKGIS